MQICETKELVMEKKVNPVNRVNIHSLTIRPFLSHLLSHQAVRVFKEGNAISNGHYIRHYKCLKFDFRWG